MINKVEIVVGFLCNSNCLFCSVGKRNFNKTTEQIKKDIDRAILENPREINFTGGEPTIRKDIFELVNYAKGRINEIRITTNGRMFSSSDFTKKIVESGLTGAIFSIHSPYPKIHDYLVQVNGAFDQAIKGLKNLRRFTNDIDVNIVINKLNYKSLPKLTDMLFNKFDVRSICFIYPDIDGNLLKNLWLVPRYGEIKNFLHRALDIVRKHKKTAWSLNIPPCFFEGYEEYSSLYELKTKMFWPNQDTDLDEKRKEGKVKIDACKECKYNSACPGISKKYVDLYGTKDLLPAER